MKVRLQLVKLINIGKEGFGHHQVITYRNFGDEIEMFAKILKIETINLGK